MENFIFEPHPKNCLKFMVQRIKKAKKSINLITLRINFKYKIDGEIIGNLLLKKSKEGVKINILLNKYWSYFQMTNQFFLNDENINIIYYEPKTTNWIIKYLFSKIGVNLNDCCGNSVHLRLFMVDEEIAMVGNCDFLKAYNWKKKLLKGLYFEDIMLEYGIIFKPDKEIIRFVNKCFSENPDFQIGTDKYVCNGYYLNTHLKKLFEYIDLAEDFIFIDNQVLSIFGIQHIFNKLMDKFIKKYREGKVFKVVIIFNKYLKDTFTFWNILYIFSNELSLSYLYNYLVKHGVDKEYIHQNWILFDSFLYQTHNKLFVVDDKYAIYGSSNFYFRSWNPGVEFELSLVLKGKKVKEMRNQIEYYFLNTKNDLSYEEIFKRKKTLYKRVDNSYNYYRLLILLKMFIIGLAILFFVKHDFLKNLKSRLSF